MFLRRNEYLPKRSESSCRNYTILVAQNATTIIHFIVTAKILMVIRSINADAAIINLHPSARGRRGQIAGGDTHPVLCAGRPASCTTTMSITATTAVATKAATTHFSFGKTRPYNHPPCQLCSENTISSECVILSISSSQPFRCSISAKIHLEISA